MNDILRRHAADPVEQGQSVGPIPDRQRLAVEFNSVHVVGDAPWEAILAAARRNKCDGIVMASHGRRGVSALLLGSETQKVLTHTKLPVIVVR